MKSALYIFIFLLPCSIYAQQNSVEKFRVMGLIVDEESNPVSFGNAAIFKQADSSLVTGSVSDAQGRFEFSAPSGKYYLKISYISYEDKFISNVNISGRDVNLGVIQLSATTDVLEEVVVKGNRGQMQLKLDKRVFNVAADPGNISRNASDILDNIPSVSVDVEGNVSLRGSQNVRILVDGKPSGLVGISGTDALRQLQGNIIERIEVITNPSSKYEAEGSAGIINIVLKKERQKGFNGAFTGNVGIPTELGFSGNVNYRQGRFNIFANYGIEYDKRPGNGTSYQVFYPGTDSTYTTFRDREHERGGISHAFRMGTDFSLTDNDIITASGLFRISDEENESQIRYEDIAADGSRSALTRRDDVEQEDEQNQEYQLSYKRIFPGEDHELVVDFQYRDGQETERSNIVESYPTDEERPDLLQRSVNEEGDENFLLQADYAYPITENKKFEAGYRGTIREISSNYRVEEQNEAGEWESLENFTNQFIYDENVQAAYLIFQNDMDQWGYQLGLRSEYTKISTFQRETKEKNENDYLDLFPTAFLSYKIDKQNTLQGSYSRRISRPHFWYLNPFYTFSDRRNIRTGNPYLSPEYTDSYEVGFLNNLEKSSIYGGVYYRHTTGYIQRVSFVEIAEGDSIATTFSQPNNLGVEDAFGIEANFTFDPTPWLAINGDANFYRSIVEGTFEEQEMDRDTYTANFQLSGKVTTGPFDFQLEGDYRAPETTTQGKRKGMYRVDFGANWRVMQGRGILNLNVRDLFNTRKFRGITRGDNFYEETEFQWRSRQVTLSFTYLINRRPNAGEREGGDGSGGGFDNGGGGGNGNGGEF